MAVISLPQFLEVDESVPVQVYDYHIHEARLRNQINLTKNTFSFLLEGSKELVTDHAPIAINNSEFLLMKSGHCLMTENLSAANQSYRSILLFFSNKTLFHFLEKHDIRQQSPAGTVPVKVCAYDAFISSFVQNLASIQQLPIRLQEKMLPVKLEEILLYLVETQGPEVLLFLIAQADSQSRNLLQVVENNKFNKLTLKELAFLSNMSVSTFKREFEKHYQESPIRWFQEQRLDHAAFLLRNQAVRPTDIFEDIGYENLSAFIQAFKSKFGVTPKQFQLNK